MKNIKSIAYPNTVADRDKSFYKVGTNCDKIVEINKNGEMALLTWLQVIKDNKVIAEIKESVCDVFGEDDIKKDEIDF